jgi:putative transposase
MAQRLYFARAAGTARFAWNWALAEWKRQYNAGGRPSEMALKRQLNAVKREQFPWMYDVTKCAAEDAIFNLGMAFRALLREARPLSALQAQGRPTVFLCCYRNPSGRSHHASQHRHRQRPAPFN